MRSPALVVAYKEAREILRDRLFLGLAFVLPILLMIVFGYGLNQTTENLSLVVVDEDQSALSRGYVDHFRNQRTFSHVGYVHSESAAERALADGSARVALIIPAGFARELGAAHSATVRTLIDGAQPAAGSNRTLEGYLEATSSSANADLALDFVSNRLSLSRTEAERLLRPLRLEVRHLYNPDMINMWFTAPALVMFVLIFVTPLLMTLGVVREKESGSIYNIYSSTVRRGEFLIGKLLPNVVISFSNALVLWAMAMTLFGAPFRGSAWCFAFASFLYVFAISGLGLLLSLLVRTQQAAMIISVLVATVIGSQYSGMISPVSSMTGVAYWIARLMPPMYYLDIAHGTFLKGLGFAELWRELSVLSLYSVLALLLAAVLFRKRVAT